MCLVDGSKDIAVLILAEDQGLDHFNALWCIDGSEWGRNPQGFCVKAVSQKLPANNLYIDIQL